MPASWSTKNRVLVDPDTPVDKLPGIGSRRAADLRSKGIATALDCVFHLPYRYEDWRWLSAPHELNVGRTHTLMGKLHNLQSRPVLARGSLLHLRAKLLWKSASVPVVWFNFPRYIAKQIPVDCEVLVHGRVVAGIDGLPQIVNPEVEKVDGEPDLSLRPIYSLPSSIGQRMYRRLVDTLLSQLDQESLGSIPESLRISHGILKCVDALRFLHRPPCSANVEDLEQGRTEAHRALALDELFTFELALCLEANRARSRKGYIFDNRRHHSDRFLDRLGFELTDAQKRVLAEIDCDLVAGRPMNRLLIGEVGSGKTVIALWAALRAIESGWQATIMAPVGLLAEQHYLFAQRHVEPLGVRCGLLTGDIARKQRDILLQAISKGDVQLVVGTQALVQKDVTFSNLGLAVIDEQHRFGVLDRARLKGLAANAHMLLMTSTPIPRSLALVAFANLDVSVLDELPPGRGRVRTQVILESEFPRVEALVRYKLAQGGRAYFIVPAIGGECSDLDEREGNRFISVHEMVQILDQGELRSFRIGVLHGRMAPSKREATMRAFRDGALDILVATSLVEVGIDVPQASVMVIMGAERFGLAQLHQLRGRVGRGSTDSDCILVVRDDAFEQARERLEIVLNSASGADIARADMKIRGPGDLLGSRQSGELPLRFARFIGDAELISDARALALEVLSRDPELKSPELSGARRALRRLLVHGFSLADVG